MTEQELEIVKLRLRLDVLLVLIRSLYTGLANSSPTATQALRDRFQELRREHSKIVLKGTPPEFSDMISAEYQEALDDYLKFIEDGLKS